MRFIQNESAKQEVLAAFRRYRFSPNKSQRDLVVKTALGEAIIGTGYAISFVGRDPIRYYDVGGVLCHEEYGPLDGEAFPWPAQRKINRA